MGQHTKPSSHGLTGLSTKANPVYGVSHIRNGILWQLGPKMGSFLSKHDRKCPGRVFLPLCGVAYASEREQLRYKPAPNFLDLLKKKKMGERLVCLLHRIPAEPKSNMCIGSLDIELSWGRRYPSSNGSVSFPSWELTELKTIPSSGANTLHQAYYYLNNLSDKTTFDQNSV